MSCIDRHIQITISNLKWVVIVLSFSYLHGSVSAFRIQRLLGTHKTLLSNMAILWKLENFQSFERQMDRDVVSMNLFRKR